MRKSTVTIREFIDEKTREYEVALLSQFDAINLAAHAYMDFAFIQSHHRYYRQHAYENFIRANRSVLSSLAKEIDSDMRRYWEYSLRELYNSHSFLCEEYKKKVTSRKKKDKFALFNKPREAQLGMIDDDIKYALKELPRDAFSDASHVKRWHNMALLCAPVITDAFAKHKEVVQVIKEIDAARHEAIRRRVGVLGSITSKAVDLAVPFLLGAPI